MAGEGGERAEQGLRHSDCPGIIERFAYLRRASKRAFESRARFRRLAPLAAHERYPEVRLGNQPWVGGFRGGRSGLLEPVDVSRGRVVGPTRLRSADRRSQTKIELRRVGQYE